jgi:hypothetical protein
MIQIAERFYEFLRGHYHGGFALGAGTIKPICLRSGGKYSAPDHTALIAIPHQPAGMKTYATFLKLGWMLKRPVENSRQRFRSGPGERKSRAVSSDDILPDSLFITSPKTFCKLQAPDVYSSSIVGIGPT